ncbi:DNA-binding response regulator [Amycolatopsis alba DSM 44262]|uniref:DNA-binding response regulator n=2 Tax=Amycolatopsis alba TaxID=76020 RepID=A0A229S7Y3_AMYAL|nr:DNA-binding response regulator [Amycolatopsis alba DSM 44262]
MRVLLITGDPDVAARLTDAFGRTNCAAERVTDAGNGLIRALSREFDIIVLDRRLQAGRGLALMRKLRRAQVLTPVIMLTAGGQVQDRVACLQAGSDDCVDDLTEAEELLARVRALHRRSPQRTGTVHLGAARVDVARRVVMYENGAWVTLTRRECAVIAVLGSEPGRVVSRARLQALVFPERQAKSIVDTYVYHLRRKLGREVIATVHSVGYRLGYVPFD